MIVYQIKLPAAQDEGAFIKFMQEEYFPAVHKGATRVGQVTSLELLQGGTDTGASTREFLWLVGWSGLSSGDVRIDDESAQKKFKSFKARLKRLGSYREIAAWDEGDAQ
jgi:hypothetical protein